MLIGEVLIPLVLLHGKPGIILHPDMEAGVPHRAGKELVDALLGQAGDGQVELLRPAELDGVAAGELRLLQHLHQIAQRLVAAPLGAVPGGDADGGKGVVG